MIGGQIALCRGGPVDGGMEAAGDGEEAEEECGSALRLSAVTRKARSHK